MLCQRWMDEQRYSGRVRWIVVDDGAEPQPLWFNRWPVELVRPRPYWRPGQNTLARNILAGLELVSETDRVVIIEDDDHYHPDWLLTVMLALDDAELVGQARSRYYNVDTHQSRDLGEPGHASLCATAVKGAAIDTLRKVCEIQHRNFIDIRLWKQHRNRKLIYGNWVTGIKGMPGRGGIGVGHKKRFQGSDAGHLSDWIGDDARFYVQ